MRNFLFYQTFLAVVFLSQLDGRTLRHRREVEPLTAIPTMPSTPNGGTTMTTQHLTSSHSIPTVGTTASEHSTKATTASSRFTPTPNTTRSLYDELMAASITPSLYEELMASSITPSFESFETSSEFMNFKSMKMTKGSSDESSSDESLMKKFAKDESDFKNNVTKEERHTINEALFDEESVQYSSIKMNSTKPQESVTTTTTPVVLTTMKKGKYLDLMPPTKGENINHTIPNTAEVWALAGMRGMRDFDDDSGSGIDLLDGTWTNNTAKNLLDWSEIAKMTNDSVMQASSTEENQTTVPSNLSGADDPATSENKGVDIFVASQHVTTASPISETLVEDIQVEHESGKSTPKQDADKTRSNIDVFSKSLDDSEESAIELIDPFKKIATKTKESFKVDKAERYREALLTTESTESETSTESAELFETTTTENYETTTSLIDSFTVAGEDNEIDEIFKRTITEQPPSTTEQPASVKTSTTEMTMETTTELPRTSADQNPASKQRKSTKSIASPTTTTETSKEEPETTLPDSKGLSSTLLPKYATTNQSLATTQHYEFPGTSSSTVEIFDDEKFKYSTVLPETTTAAVSTPEVAAKSNNDNESTVKNDSSLNQESLNDDQGMGSLGIISAVVSVVVLLVIGGAAYFIMKRRNNLKFNQRCRPVGLDAYSLDNVSVYNSVRRKANALRMSKRSYGNSAFEDPSLQSNVLDYQSLQDFAKNKMSIQNEFKEIPLVTVRVDEMPENCEDKNRYANVVPLPESRVALQRLNDEEKSEYINANFVRGPTDNTNYYIATQAPLENTVPDFWRMIWEQNSKVIVMATNLTENGVERCAEYLPASVVIDNSQSHGDFQVTLKSREVKGKYAVSQIHLKNLKTNTWREIMHLWYSWPENGCPADDSSVISLLLEARGYLRNALPEHMNESSNGELNNNMSETEKISTLDKTKSLQRVQGPLTVHCSPGTGRTGTLIACDIILRMLETPPRRVDIPQIVYAVRKGRANAIRSKDQYEFIYSIANSYAMKLNSAPTES